MKPKSGALVALCLVFAVAPSYPRECLSARGTVLTADLVLSPEIEAQLKTVERLVHSKTVRGGPDPALFGALGRLEEMLPRTTATRRAQEKGKMAYTAMVRSRSTRLAREWPALRSAIEREMQQDKQYARAVEALDRRLAIANPGQAPGITLTPVSSVPTGPAKPQAFPFEQMRPGDILIWDDRSGPPMVRVALALFAQKCTHSALYLGETSSRAHGVQRWTLEAQSPALGVRSSVMGRKWTRPGLHVSLGHVKGITPGRAAQLAAGAIDAYGTDGRTPYHIWPPWDKTYYQEGLYCSQLLWAVYQQNGVDLDSNDWHYLAWFTVHNWFNPYAAPTAYFAVFPDEIKASPHITWYYDQANPR